MSLEDTIRQIVRDEIRAALADLKQSDAPKSEADPLDDYLTSEQVAGLTQLSPSTLKKFRSMAKGPAFTRVARHAVRYQRRDVLAWMTSQRRSGS